MDINKAIDLLVHDRLESIRVLIGAGELDIAARDRNGRNLLQNALSADAENVVRFLLSIGADVHAKNKWGMGALSDAVRVGRAWAIPLLLGAGARIDEVDSMGRTPLHQAVLAASEVTSGMVKELIERGADPDERNQHGDSVRNWAENAMHRPGWAEHLP